MKFCFNFKLPIMNIIKLNIFVLLFFMPILVFSETSKEQYLRIQNQEILRFENKKISDLDYNLDYVKITTNRDAIAIVPMSSILQLVSKWEGVNPKNFLLLHRNIVKPYYLIDKNGKLDSQDTLVFLGMHPTGDTTYYDHYATEEPFFVTYDESRNAINYQILNDDGSFLTQVEEISISDHIEKDINYSVGSNLPDSHTGPNEGWYWKELFAENEEALNTFTTIVNLYPQINQNIQIDIAFKSIIDSLYEGLESNKFPEHRIVAYLNGDSLDSREFKRLYKDTFRLIVPYNRIAYGPNIIKVKSFEVHPFRNGVVAIDFIETRYLSQPIRNNMFNSFDVTNNSSNSICEINRYNSNYIIAIDTINKHIQFPKATKIDSKLIANIWAKKHIIGIEYNNIHLDFEKKGLLLVKLNQMNYTSESITPYYFDKNELDKFFIKDKTFLYLILFTDSIRIISNEFIDYFHSLGFSLAKINDLSIGDSYFAVMDNSKVFLEDKSKSDVLSYSVVINEYTEDSYSAKLLLTNSIQSHFTINDINDLSDIKVYKVNKPNFLDTNNAANVLVIYHNDFKQFAEDYTNYRKSTYPNLKFKLIDAESIYDEFNFGKKSPYSIKNLIYFARNYWQDSLQSVVIIGNASWDAAKRQSYAVSTDFIPSYGFPPADYWYAILSNNLDPLLNIGRISISNLEDGYIYLNKLKDYDSIPNAPWMKNFLFLSGGENDPERAKFAKVKSYFFDEIIKETDMCGTTDSVRKFDSNIGGTAEASDIRNKINNGALWVNFLGHANQSIFDMEGWQVDKLNNYQKYAFFSTISCNTGAHADPGIIHSRNESYVFFKNKGFIGSIGSSTYGWVDENRLIIQRIIKNLSDTSSNLQYIGDLLNYGKKGLMDEGAQLYTQFHNALIGDPLLKLRTSRKPDLYIYSNEISLENIAGSTDISTTDSIAYLKGRIYNNGLKSTYPTNVMIIHSHQNNIDTIYINVPEVCSFFDFEEKLDISQKLGENVINIIIDPNKLIDDYNFENNQFEITTFIYSSTLLPIEPQQNWNMDTESPLFRVINKEHNEKTNYTFSIYENDTLVYISNTDEIGLFENYLEWKPQVKLSEGEYKFVAFYENEDGKKSNPLIINFNAINTKINDTISMKFSTSKSFTKFDFSNLILKDEEIKLDDVFKKVQLVSVSGDYSKNIIEWGIMEVGDKVYLDARYFRGFNLLVFPPEYSTKEPIYRRFDTWIDGDTWIQDSTPVQLVRFIRDSIPDGSYLMIATNGKSFKTPVLRQMYDSTSIGSYDTLRAELRKFGAKLIDSVNGIYTYPAVSWDGWTNSYAMIGKKGWASGEAIEAHNPSGDSAIVNADIKFLVNKGDLTLNNLQNLQNLMQIIVNSNAHIDSLEKYRMNLLILNQTPTQIDTIYQITLTENIQEINFQLQALTEFDKMQIQIHLERLNEFSEPKLQSIDLKLKPLHELAIKKSNTLIDDSSTIRGKNNTLHIIVENLSPRITSDSLKIRIWNNNSVLIYEDTKQPIQANSKEILDISLKSELLEDDNNLNIEINNNNSSKEFYLFNNSRKITHKIINDNQKPNIKVMFDGKEVKDGDYIALNPTINLQIYDNSPFQFSDTNQVEIFINGQFITSDLPDYYYRYFNISSEQFKYQCIFVPNNLEFGDNIDLPANYFKFIARDAIGNADTLIYKLNVRQNNSIENIKIYPNPVETNQINLSFDYLTRYNSSYASIEISNLEGQLIKTFQKQIGNGKNNLILELFDNESNELPAGIYTFKIEVQSDLWTEPKVGYFIKM